LSEAIPPVTSKKTKCTPEGCQQAWVAPEII
jgi:hypothetical protein